MAGQIVINQHFVPRFYLKRFAYREDNCLKVHVYDKANKRYFTNSLSGVGSEKNFFEDGSVEPRLTQIESEIQPSLNNVVESFTTGSRKLRPYDKVRLAQLLAFQLNRTRAARKQLEDLQDYFIKTTTEHLQVTDGMTKEDVQKLIPTIPVENLHAQMLDNSVSFKFADTLLFQYGWFFVRASNGKGFVTSDHPVRASHNWLTHPENCIIYPLSATLVLVLQQGEQNRGCVGELGAPTDLIISSNYNQAVGAHRFVYSNSLEVLEKTISSLAN